MEAGFVRPQHSNRPISADAGTGTGPGPSANRQVSEVASVRGAVLQGAKTTEVNLISTTLLAIHLSYKLVNSDSSVS